MATGAREVELGKGAKVKLLPFLLYYFFRCNSLTASIKRLMTFTVWSGCVLSISDVIFGIIFTKSYSSGALPIASMQLFSFAVITYFFIFFSFFNYLIPIHHLR